MLGAGAVQAAHSANEQTASSNSHRVALECSLTAIAENIPTSSMAQRKPKAIEDSRVPSGTILSFDVPPALT